MATDELLERTLERARQLGAEQAEAYFTSSSSDSVSFANNRLEGIDSSSARGLGIRVFVDGRLGFSSTSILDRLDEAVAAAVDTARLTPVETDPFQFPAGGETEADLRDPAVDAVEVEELTELGRAAIARLQPMADGVLAGAGGGRATAEVQLANSAGLRARWQRSAWWFNAVAQRVEGTSILWCYDGDASSSRDLDPELVIESTAAKLRDSLREGHLPAATRPVIFTPAALGALLGALRIGVSGSAIHRRTSPLAGRLGEQVLSPLVTLHDDNRPGSGRSGTPMDDEGVPSSVKSLVEAGVLRGYLADLRHAARLGVEPGRGGRGGYTAAPSPISGNWTLEAGDRPLRALLAEAEGGILVDSLMGMHGSNLANGDFSVTIGLGFAIGRGGETLFRVKDAAIAGNVYEILGPRLAGFSSERRRGYSGTDLLPWALVHGVAIA